VVTIVRDDGAKLAIPHNEDATEVRAPATEGVMMAKRTHGKTASGKEITDELVEKLADEAEAGYDVEETLRRRVVRPPIGSGPASVESVRLDPELSEALAERAARDHETTSSVIRKALRTYLGSAERDPGAGRLARRDYAEAVRAEVKRLWSPDFSDGHSLPDDLENCSVLIQADIGPVDGEGADTFNFEVWTPDALARRVQADERAFWARGMLILPRFSWRAVETAIAQLVHSFAGQSWDEIAGKLSRFARWEFEDYEPS
jgi:hypothetical protein